MGEVLTFGAIAEFFKEEIKLISRGENAVKSNHVKSLEFDAELRIIRGEIYASMKDKFYSVMIYLDVSYNIEKATCTCPKGQYFCHHMAALSIFGKSQISVTDTSCQWSIRKPSSSSTVNTIEELYPSRAYVAVKQSPTSGDEADFVNSLGQYGAAVGFTWLLKPEPQPSDFKLVVDVEDIVFSKEYLESDNKNTFLLNAMKITEEKIKEIVVATIGQHENQKWLIARKHRLTASKFGAILRAINIRQRRKTKYPASLFKQLTESYNLQGVKSIQWGTNHEAAAKEQFTFATQKMVEETGIWFHPSGVLGASPDGLVGNDAIIEIKCPYKFREGKLSEQLKEDKNYIIHMDKTNNLILNKEHEYYQQIQGTLAITKRKTCYLVIWTPNETIIRTIEKEDDWEENLNLLLDFFINVYIPNIINDTE